MVRACPSCGSRRWRRDNVTGSAVCEDGHVYQDFRVEDQDADGPSQHALQRRKMKTGKRGPKKESGRKNEEYYEGDDAEYLQIQALQILLRTQVQALRKLWDLPDVYEIIVRDLWTYQLAISALPPPPSLPDSTQPQSISALTLSQPATSSGFAGMLSTQNGNADDNDTSDEDENNGSGGEKEDEEPEVDPELLEEMSQLSEMSDKEEDMNLKGRKGGRGKVRKKRRLKVSDTLVVLSVGLWMVRKGIMCVDMEQIVNGNTIPYLDFAHTTLLPDGMRKHMNRTVMLSLSPIRCPTPKYIFSSIRLFARILQADFGIIVPDINLPLISWRVISSLGGSPVVYSQVTRLLDLLDLNTSLLETSTSTRTRLARGSRRNSTKSGGPSRPPSRGRSSSRMNIDDDVNFDDGEDILAEAAKVFYRRTDRNRDVIMPELAIAAAWIIVMKMAYGLDGYDRRATDEDDPVIGMPIGKVWNEELEKRLRGGKLNIQRKELEKHDFTSMAMEDIDRYLNNAEDLLLKDRDAPPGCDSTTFPLSPQTKSPPPLPPPTSYRNFHTIQPIIPSTPGPLTPGTGIPPEPGEELRTYDPKDTLGTLPKAYDIVIRSAAEVVGVRLEDVAEVVQLLERRLEKVRKERKVSVRGKWGGGRVKDRSKSRKRANGAEVVEFEADEGSEIEVDSD